jgi:WYL domain-containing protein
MVRNPSVDLEERALQLGQLLIWEGMLTRSRVMEIYGLSPVRSSEWIRGFRERFPRWSTWDSIGRRYLATEEAFRAWRKEVIHPAGDQGFAKYLGQVGLSSSYPNEDFPNVLSAFPDFSSPSPAIFASLRRAIEEGLVAELTYRSLGNPEPHKRVVEPHNLIRAGRRWHVRAYCQTNGNFRDYSLGRIAKAALLQERATHGANEDERWTTRAQLTLVAHPALSAAQAEVVRFEYFHSTAARKQSCRAALVPYLIQDLRAATDPATQRPPDYQLAVANIEELRPWLFPP